MSALMPIAMGVGFVGLGSFAAYSSLSLRRANRERYIREFVLPQGLYKNFRKSAPGSIPNTTRSLRAH
jgi:hypothetical protein